MKEECAIVEGKPLRILLIIIGTISLALGIVGIALPVLPTTPFLLLAAACYARGSKKFYDWLMCNRFFGSYIRNYREGRGVPIKIKIVSITFLWAAILVSMYLVESTIMRVVLPIIAVMVTIHILTLKTLSEKSK